MATDVYGFDYWLVFQCGVGPGGGVGPTEDWWADAGVLVWMQILGQCGPSLLARHFDAGRQLDRLYLLKMYGRGNE